MSEEGTRALLKGINEAVRENNLSDTMPLDEFCNELMGLLPEWQDGNDGELPEK
jgi:hypothetical protein